jgi:hypothetical protein
MISYLKLLYVQNSSSISYIIKKSDLQLTLQLGF